MATFLPLIVPERYQDINKRKTTPTMSTQHYYKSNHNNDDYNDSSYIKDKCTSIKARDTMVQQEKAFDAFAYYSNDLAHMETLLMKDRMMLMSMLM